MKRCAARCTVIAMGENAAWGANAATGNQNFVGGGSQDANSPSSDGCNASELEGTGLISTSKQGMNEMMIRRKR
jgi:hypothetical protein